MLRSRLYRRFVSGAVLVLLSAAAVAASGKLRRPYEPDAPPHRQRGAPEAPIRIAVFSDFQCPHCASAVEPLNQLEQIHGGKLRILFKYLIWERVHPHGRAAAAAAECAGQQERFWPYHDLLFARQMEWGEARNPERLFEDYARRLKLDLKRWKECRASHSALAAVDADIQEAKRHWVRSTPTFFINGKRYSGVWQLRNRGTAQIERELAKAP